MALPAASSNIRWLTDHPLRAAGGAVLLALLAHGQTGLAQQRAPRSQTLEELIPDEAVADPEGWAAQGAQALPLAAEPDEPASPDGGLDESADAGPPPVPEEIPALLDELAEVAPDTPMADIPGLTLDWPDLAEVPDFTPLDEEGGIRFAELDSASLAALPNGVEQRISRELVLVFPPEDEGFPERAEFARRFADLSTILALDGDGDDLARLAARSEEDEQLLLRLLRIYGYFNGQAIRTVVDPGQTAEGRGDDPAVRFEILPGEQYRFGQVDLGPLQASCPDYDRLCEAFGIAAGDPLLQDRIIAGEGRLATALGEAGYPFAQFGAPRLLVDHEREEGDLSLQVEPGGKYRFGQVNSNLPEFLSGRHLASIARFRPGDIYSHSDQLDLRQAILATGLVGAVGVSPREVSPPDGAEPGVVELDVVLEPAPLRTITGAVGYGSGEGFRLAASWEHRNLFPPEGMLRVRAVAGTREQLGGITYRRNNFRGRDRVLTVDTYASKLDRDAFVARTVAASATYEQLSTLLFQKPISWSVGLEVLATRESEIQARDLRTPDVTYLVGALPLRILYDTSDSLLDPTRGFRLGARVSPEVSNQNDRTAFYVSTQFDLSYYRQVSDSVVLAARARAGTIQGAELVDIAPSRRFYAGGGASVRGFAYQAIGPRNGVGGANGGRSLVEASLEARIRTGLFDGALAVVPFVDAGSVDRDTLPGFEEIRVGAGIGIRYYTTFGPMRVDVATPINPGPDDSRIGVYVSLGQAF